ncbi:MAG: hypothetical protein ACI86S_001703 [Paracoccaceae bacterium]|jgi:hypothetical protein
MTKISGLILVLAVLSACGADGPPVRPSAKAGVAEISGNLTVGVNL